MPRRPKPLEQHLADGTKSEVGRPRIPGTRRRAPRPAPGAPVRATPLVVGGRGELEPPPHLSGEALEVWHELVAARREVLDVADAPMVELAAVHLATVRAAHRVVAEHGAVIRDEAGLPVRANPMLAVRDSATRAAHRALVELGVGPSARARLAMTGGAEAEPESAIPGLAELVALDGGAA